MFMDEEVEIDISMKVSDNQDFGDDDDEVREISKEEFEGTDENIGPNTPKPFYKVDNFENCGHNLVCDCVLDDDDDEGMELKASDEANSDVTINEVHLSIDEDEVQPGDKEFGHEDDDQCWELKSSMSAGRIWFCANCTKPNLDDSVNCRFCREHQKSGILDSGFRAPAEVPYEMVFEEKGVSMQGTPIMPSASCPLSLLPLSSSAPLRSLTAIGYDERMLMHFEIEMTLRPHPERPDRLRSIVAGLKAAGLFDQCFTIFPREATRAELESVHTWDHVNAVEATSCRKSCYFSEDTYTNKNSALAARLAAGISADLASAIMEGRAQNGIALVRPPGHHAEISTVMGFCLHNNVAVAAKSALASGARKVLIVDWDVHHGNGTQEIFESDPHVLYVSLHRYEGGLFYPGTGAASEVGKGEGTGFSVNIPWGCSGIGDDDYIFAVQQIILPIGRQFAPDMTIISAGFDAAKGDPLGGCEVTPMGYGYMAQMLSCLAQGKMLVILEGGYNLRSMSASVAAVVKVLLGENPGFLPKKICPTRAGLAAMLEVVQYQLQYWKGLHIPLEN